MTQWQLLPFKQLVLCTYYVPGTVLGAESREVLICTPGCPEPACSWRSPGATQRKGPSAPRSPSPDTVLRAPLGKVAYAWPWLWSWPGGPWSLFHLLLWKRTLTPLARAQEAAATQHLGN